MNLSTSVYNSGHHAQISDLFWCKAGYLKPTYLLLGMRKIIHPSKKPSLALCVGLHSCKAKARWFPATCKQKMRRSPDDTGRIHLQMLTSPTATTTKTELRCKRNSEPSLVIPSLFKFKWISVKLIKGRCNALSLCSLENNLPVLNSSGSGSE